MTLYKFINETYIKKPTNPIKENGKAYSNPTHETLLSLGYLPLVKAIPENKEGFYALPHYKVENNQIIQSWTYHEISEEEEV